MTQQHLLGRETLRGKSRPLREEKEQKIKTGGRTMGRKPIEDGS